MAGKLTFYSEGESHWPDAWILPELHDDDQDLFGKLAYLTDDLTVRTAINVWDNCLRAPGSFEGIVGGVISAHARLVVGSGRCADLEKAADAIGEMWLEMARQALRMSSANDGGDA